MYQRLIQAPEHKSFFLFWPRWTGKTTWLKSNFKDSIYIDLLNSENYNDLLAYPNRLEKFFPMDYKWWVIIDEIQKIPELLNEVHRLIENNKIKFVLTWSSSRKIKRNNDINLLAWRALKYNMYPLTSIELWDDFSILKCLQNWCLPSVFNEEDPKKYLETYVHTYLEQEIKQEWLTRNLWNFSRFLEVASFSQWSVLNVSEIAREASINRKLAENYFSILEDLMIAYQIPVFTKKAKRRMINHTKFYFFDIWVYKIIRPKWPLDAPEEIEWMSLETLVLQELIALNEYLQLNYNIYYWKTASWIEVDFILYWDKWIKAIEIKRKSKIWSDDLKWLKTFLWDYKEATWYLLYWWDKVLYEKDNIQIIPIEYFLKNIRNYL